MRKCDYYFHRSMHMLRISLECGTKVALDTVHYQTEGVNTSHEAEQIPQW